MWLHQCYLKLLGMSGECQGRCECQEIDKAAGKTKNGEGGGETNEKGPHDENGAYTNQ